MSYEKKTSLNGALRRHLVSWNKLGGVGETVVHLWVSQVVSQVLEWSLSSHNSLDEESKHGEHSQASVLDLLHLELSKGIWVVSQSQWVEGLSWVEWVQSLSSWSSVDSVSLNESHEHNLGEGHGDDGLGVDESWVSEVVESILGEDGGTGLEPHSGVSKVGSSVVLEELWGEASQGSQHSPSGVDHLALSVAGESLWVGRETGGIPSVVSWELTSEVWHLWGEWSQELDSVWAIELHGSAGHLAGSLQQRNISSGHGSRVKFSGIKFRIRSLGSGRHKVTSVVRKAKKSTLTIQK